MVERDFINVRDNGTVSLFGDGRNSDSWLLQRIIDGNSRARGTNGRTIYFPPGRYRMDAIQGDEAFPPPVGTPAIHIGMSDAWGHYHGRRQGIRFVGEPGESILVCGGLGPLFLIARSSDITFEGLSIEANRAAAPFVGPFAPGDIFFDELGHVIWHSSGVSGFPMIGFAECARIRIRDTHVFAMQVPDPAHPEYEGDHFPIDRPAFYFQKCTNVDVRRNRIEDAQLSFAACAQVHVVENTIERPPYRGILVGRPGPHDWRFPDTLIPDLTPEPVGDDGGGPDLPGGHAGDVGDAGEAPAEAGGLDLGDAPEVPPEAADIGRSLAVKTFPLVGADHLYQIVGNRIVDAWLGGIELQAQDARDVAPGDLLSLTSIAHVHILRNEITRRGTEHSITRLDDGRILFGIALSGRLESGLWDNPGADVRPSHIRMDQNSVRLIRGESEIASFGASCAGISLVPPEHGHVVDSSVTGNQITAVSGGRGVEATGALRCSIGESQVTTVREGIVLQSPEGCHMYANSATSSGPTYRLELSMGLNRFIDNVVMGIEERDVDWVHYHLSFVDRSALLLGIQDNELHLWDGFDDILIMITDEGLDRWMPAWAEEVLFRLRLLERWGLAFGVAGRD